MKQIVRESKKRIWRKLSADAGASFTELWRRTEEGQLPDTKTEICRFIGCSLRWAEEIVAEAARRSP
jgi:hypothetical protein